MVTPGSREAYGDLFYTPGQVMTGSEGVCGGPGRTVSPWALVCKKSEFLALHFAASVCGFVSELCWLRIAWREPV